MHLAILGNGITGVSAALRVRERCPDWRITLVSGESKHHWSRPALMYVFMGHMRYEDTKPFEDSFWVERRLELVRGWVTGIDLERKELVLHRAPPLHWDKLLIATGSKPNRFGWAGQDLRGVQGLWGLPDLKRLYESAEHADRAVIVGGGLIGVELAEMLHSRGIHVTVLARESAYWNNVLPDEEARLVGRAIERHGVELRLSTELDSIEDDGTGRCGAVRTKPRAGGRDETGERIECQIVGLTVGVSPNLDVVQGSAIRTGRGVLVDPSLRTNVPDVFAAGDCAEIEGLLAGRNVIQQVWYTGKLQGETAGDVISGLERRYDPGVWFNSAKFFDLEYQTYGRVGMKVAGEQSLYWEHASGLHAVRIVHVGGKVIGFNTLGIRWRHALAECWIQEARPLDSVLERLGELHFDPEFFRAHEPEIARTFRVARAREKVA